MNTPHNRVSTPPSSPSSSPSATYRLSNPPNVNNANHSYSETFLSGHQMIFRRQIPDIGSHELEVHRERYQSNYSAMEFSQSNRRLPEYSSAPQIIQNCVIQPNIAYNSNQLSCPSEVRQVLPVNNDRRAFQQETTLAQVYRQNKAEQLFSYLKQQQHHQHLQQHHQQHHQQQHHQQQHHQQQHHQQQHHQQQQLQHQQQQHSFNYPQEIKAETSPNYDSKIMNPQSGSKSSLNPISFVPGTFSGNFQNTNFYQTQQLNDYSNGYQELSRPSTSKAPFGHGQSLLYPEKHFLDEDSSSCDLPEKTNSKRKKFRKEISLLLQPSTSDSKAVNYSISSSTTAINNQTPILSQMLSSGLSKPSSVISNSYSERLGSTNYLQYPSSNFPNTNITSFDLSRNVLETHQNIISPSCSYVDSSKIVSENAIFNDGKDLNNFSFTKQIKETTYDESHTTKQIEDINGKYGKYKQKYKKDQNDDKQIIENSNNENETKKNKRRFEKIQNTKGDKHKSDTKMNEDIEKLLDNEILYKIHEIRKFLDIKKKIQKKNFKKSFKEHKYCQKTLFTKNKQKLKMSKSYRDNRKKDISRNEKKLRDLQQKFILRALSYQNTILPKTLINEDDADDLVGILLQLSIIQFRNITDEDIKTVRTFINIAREKLDFYYGDVDLNNMNENKFTEYSLEESSQINVQKPRQRILKISKRAEELPAEILKAKSFVEKNKLYDEFIKILVELDNSRFESFSENLAKKIMLETDPERKGIFTKEFQAIHEKINAFTSSSKIKQNFNAFQARSISRMFQLKCLAKKIENNKNHDDCDLEDSIKFEVTFDNDPSTSDKASSACDNIEIDKIVEKSFVFLRKVNASMEIEQKKLLETKRILLEITKNDPTMKAVHKNIGREMMLKEFKNNFTTKFNTKIQRKNDKKSSLSDEDKRLMQLSVKERALLYKMKINNQLKSDWYTKFGNKINFCPSFKQKSNKKSYEEKNYEKNTKKFQKIIRGMSFTPKFSTKEDEEKKKNQIFDSVKRSIMKRIAAKKQSETEFVLNGRKRIIKTVDEPENCVQNCLEEPRRNDPASDSKSNLLCNKIFRIYLEQFRLKTISQLLQINKSTDKKFSEQQIIYLKEQYDFENDIKRFFVRLLRMIVEVKKQNINEQILLELFHQIKSKFIANHPTMIYKNAQNSTNNNSIDLREHLPALSDHFHNVYLKMKDDQLRNEQKSQSLVNQVNYCDKINQNMNELALNKTEENTKFYVQIERLLIKKALRRARIPFNPFLFPGIVIDGIEIERQSAFMDRCFTPLPCVHNSLFLKMVNYQHLFDHEHVIFLCSTDADSLRPKLLFCYEKSCVISKENSKNLCICLTCGGLFCFDKHHSHEHFKQTRHSFALSITNGFLICFLCKKFVFDYDLDPTVKFVRESLVPIWKQNLIYHWEKRLWPHSTGEYYPDLKLFRLDFSNTRMGFTGLFNLGSTCFMNSIIHVLVHAAGFREYLLTQRHHCTENNFQNCIGCEFSQMAYQLYFGSRFPVIPTRFYDLVWANIPHLAFYGEQDAHEFFTSILDVLHEHYRGNSSGACDCIVHNLFYGVLQSELTCQTCRTVRTNDEMMMGFNLDLKDQSIRPAKNLRTLEDCLNLFTKSEDLGPDMLLTCDFCNYRRQTSKRMKIKHLPPIVGFQFKRFEQVGLKSLKIPHKVSYGLDMDLGQFVDDIPKSHPDYEYTLYAVVNHIGSLHSGHYTASIRSDDNHWYLFNDEYVERISQNAVLNNMNAYMVFYRKKNMAIKFNTQKQLKLQN